MIKRILLITLFTFLANNVQAQTQTLPSFDDFFAMLSNPGKQATAMLEKNSFDTIDSNEVDDCISESYSKGEGAEEQIKFSLMICDDLVESIMISCNLEQIVDLEKGARAHPDLTVRYDNIGANSAIIFNHKNGSEFFLVKDGFFRTVYAVLQIDEQFEFFKTNMESNRGFDPENDVTTKMLAIVNVKNAKGQSVDGLIKETSPVEISEGKDYMQFAREFQQTDQAELLREKINTAFLEDEKFVEESGKLMRELIAIYQAGPITDGNPEIKFMQFLIDREMVGSMAMFTHIFENHEVAKEMRRQQGRN